MVEGIRQPPTHDFTPWHPQADEVVRGHADCGKPRHQGSLSVLTAPTFSLQAAPARARSIVRRVVVLWASDLLSLRRRNLLTPAWNSLSSAAAEGGGPARPPRMVGDSALNP